MRENIGEVYARTSISEQLHIVACWSNQPAK